MSTPSRRFEEEQQSPSNDWLDRLARFNLHFGRYMRDALGIVLMAFALMSLLALWNISEQRSSSRPAQC